MGQRFFENNESKHKMLDQIIRPNYYYPELSYFNFTLRLPGTLGYVNYLVKDLYEYYFQPELRILWILLIALIITFIFIWQQDYYDYWLNYEIRENKMKLAKDGKISIEQY